MHATEHEPAVGDLVRWQGRRFRVRGFEPMSVPDRRVELEDVVRGATVRVPFAELVAPRRASAA